MSEFDEKGELKAPPSKLNSFNQSNFELMISNDIPTNTNDGLPGSLRFGDLKRRQMLDTNSNNGTSPLQPKIELHDMNNPSQSSFVNSNNNNNLNILTNGPSEFSRRPHGFVSLSNLNNSPLRSARNSYDRERPSKDFSLQKGVADNNQHVSRFSRLDAKELPTASVSLGASLLAKRFAMKLKLKANSQLFRKLTDRQFNIIGDLSDLFNAFLNSQAYLFLPNSIFQIVWSIFSFLLLIGLILIVPVKFCFNDTIFNYDDEIISFSSFYHLANILIQLNQGIYKRGVLIKNRKMIILNYLSRIKFWIDLFILMTFLVTIQDSTSKFLRLSIIFKVGYIMDTYDSIANMLEIKNKNKHIPIFLKVVFQILVVAHLAGCFFIKLALTNQDERNWISFQNIDYTDHSNIYISAIYWSIITMITVGYGDITPKNQSEKMYVIFVSIISCGIFGYSLNIIGQIIRSKEENKLKFQNRINDLSDYMKKRSVSRDMREKIFKYFHYLHKEELQESSQVTKLVQSLPQSLKASFVVELYYHMIKTQPFFEKTFTDEFILQICNLVKEKRVDPEMNLLDIDKDNENHQDGSSTNQRLYFIINGKVAYQTASFKERVIKIFEKGECIGLQEFLTGQTCELSPLLKSQTGVMLAYIEKSDFLQLLEENPTEKEKFFMTKDKVSFSEETNLSQQKCISCSSEYHRFEYCERLHLQVNRDKMMFAQNLSKDQERNQVKMTRKQPDRKSPFYYFFMYQNDGTEVEEGRNPEFDKAKRDYITQYTRHQSGFSNNAVQLQFQAQKTTSLKKEVENQNNLRKQKKKKTNQTKAAEGSIDTRKQLLLKIQEFKQENSLSASARDEATPNQTRQKRSHSELQFGQEFLGSHQLLQFLAPQPAASTSSIYSMNNNNNNNNNNTANGGTPQNSANNFNSSIYPPTEFGHNQPQNARDINFATRKEAYFSKDDEDRLSVIMANDKKDEDINQSFSSLRKRNVAKKTTKKIKGSGVFNMDELKIKMPLAPSLKHPHLGGGVSLLAMQVDGVSGDDGGPLSVTTFNQFAAANNNFGGSLSNIPQQLAFKFPPDNIMNDSGQLDSEGLDSEDHEQDENEDEIGEDGHIRSQIQMLQQQIFLLIESKLCEIDKKKEYKIFFPESNSELVIQKVQKQVFQPIRSPYIGKRKVPKSKQSFMTPYVTKRK